MSGGSAAPDSANRFRGLDATPTAAMGMRKIAAGQRTVEAISLVTTSDTEPEAQMEDDLDDTEHRCSQSEGLFDMFEMDLD